MGPIDFTVGRDSSGNWNTSDVKAFMRCAGFIGSGGYAFILLCPFVQAHEQNWIRINGVDVIAHKLLQLDLLLDKVSKQTTFIQVV